MKRKAILILILALELLFMAIFCILFIRGIIGLNAFIASMVVIGLVVSAFTIFVIRNLKK